ncbi:MAG: hypothetical protein B7Z66_07660 [Chromatiales bacterium 21-64-14]|nr:MAG: hypothetical protein B7Z66_07660 [Chromatiales bacterium 21-64-14]HQU15931.1 DUF2182 domain-containing protein [Gammaproteobacteria bacterium]
MGKSDAAVVGNGRVPWVPTAERATVLAVALTIAGFTWLYLIHLTGAMPAMGDLARHASHPAGAMAHWDIQHALLVFIMWAAMMVAMMLPGAIPMLLLFLAVSRRQRGRPGHYLRVLLFASGYILVWSGFSLVATLLEWRLESTRLLAPMGAIPQAALGGLVLAAAGAYQWTPLKTRCLHACQTPLTFVLTRWRPGPRGAWRMGLTHGAYCVGCCWALMGLLFVGGVMNLLWAALLSIFVLAEKLVPGRWTARISGALLIGWGGWVLLAPVSMDA